MKLAYSYVRFSTKEQAKGDSHRRQTERADEWATAHGYKIVKTYEDLGVSGYTGKNRDNGKLGEFLANVEQGKIAPGSVLIVESWDRFSRRTPRQVLPDFLDIINAGVGIVTLTDRQLFTAESLDADGTQLLISLFVMMRAHEESKRKGGMVAAAWADKRRRAREESVRITDRIPAWLDVVSEGEGKQKTRRFIVNKDRAAVVRRIFRETEQGYGRRAIAKRLNREYLQGQDKCRAFGSRKTRDDADYEGWQPSYIAKLLQGEAVLGHYQPHKRNGKGKRVTDGPVIKDYYPSIIDEKIWTRAKAARVRRRNGKASGKPQSAALNLIGPLGRCACGGHMAHLNKGTPPKGGRYYVCSNALRNVHCDNNRHWRQELVERAVFFYLDKGLLEQAFEPTDDQRAPTPEDYEEHLKELRRRLKKAFAYLTEAQTDDATLKESVDELRREIALVEERQDKSTIAEVTRPDFNALKSKWAAALAFRDRLDRARGKDLIDLRRGMIMQLRSIISEVRFSEHSISVSLEVPRTPPAKLLAKWMGSVTAESKTVKDIERHYLVEVIYTEDRRILRRPVGRGEGVFVSAFPKVTAAESGLQIRSLKTG
jgi:DNA invertase Pin-like site-specific DNA recombinase